ncbi:hypothetical protein RRG08_031337 [Elysia crispata]|uniref:Uncharacterized protein n=1 Tax=Elysia crispata TaxID=231223 RepID=A0AAE0YIG6_9GAST|nr:hypothetical protein RRG08_031337 [Elysia crispata]
MHSSTFFTPHLVSDSIRQVNKDTHDGLMAPGAVVIVVVVVVMVVDVDLLLSVSASPVLAECHAQTCSSV